MNAGDMLTISYTSNGIITTSKPGGQDELNAILNLNDKYLVQNRRKQLHALKKGISSRFKNKTVPKQYWQKIYRYYSLKEDGTYREYVGILLWYLKKKI